MEDMTIGLVFPGQGTQKPEMGAPWRDTPSWQLTASIAEATGEDVAELLLHIGADALRRTDLAQIAVFTVAVMAHAEAVRLGAIEGRVGACAGHSLGEYAALTAAGVLSVPAAAALVAARGRAMRDAAEAREGTMGVLVSAPTSEVEALVAAVRADGHEVWAANYNGPGQTVVSGSPEGIGQLGERAPSIGAKMIRLQVGGAFHSPFMAPAADALRRAWKNTAYAPARVPVVANVDAVAYTDDGAWPELGARQLVSPVLWEQSVRTLTTTLGCRRLVELGPGRTLAGLIRRIDPETEVLSVDGPGALS